MPRYAFMTPFCSCTSCRRSNRANPSFCLHATVAQFILCALQLLASRGLEPSRGNVFHPCPRSPLRSKKWQLMSVAIDQRPVTVLRGESRSRTGFHVARLYLPSGREHPRERYASASVTVPTSLGFNPYRQSSDTVPECKTGSVLPQRHISLQNMRRGDTWGT